MSNKVLKRITRKNGKTLRKGAPNRREICVVYDGDRSCTYHATKGWRIRKL